MKKISIAAVLIIGFIAASFSSEQKDFKESFQRGKAVYKKVCITCHQPDGDGVPRMIPPLSKTKYILGAKEKLVHILVKGLNEEVEVNGDFYNTPMPAQPQLTNQEIADVLTFVRNSFGNKAAAVTVAEVINIRKKIK